MLKKVIALLVPFITVGTGLLVFKNAWVAILSYHLGMALVILLSKAKTPFKALFRSNSYRIPIITSLIGASSGVLLYILWPYLSVPEDIGAYARGIGLTPATWPLFLAYYICINPLIEEYYWRGFLGNNTKALTPNDVFFAGYHVIVLAGRTGISWLILISLILAAVAWFWRQMDNFSKGLLPSLTSHIAADITIISTIYILTAR